MKRIWFIVVLIIILVIIVFSKYKVNNGKKIEIETENSNRFIRVAEGVSLDMITPDFWIDRQKNPSKVIMSGLEIDIWNREYLKTDFWQDERVNENTKYGYTVERASIRKEPRETNVPDENGDERFCRLQVSSILINEPVIIFNESDDREWYYIKCGFCEGWIKKENVGICENFQQWKAVMKPKNFLLITGNREILNVDTEHEKVSEKVLYMGTMLELVESENYETGGKDRKPFHCYVVKMPIRNDEGMLEYEFAFVPISMDVNIGYLPYTMENLIEQMFKISGDRYGWGGMYDARDCSQYIMEIYNLFGFEFARNSASQASMPFDGYDISDKTDKEKIKVLDKVAIGSVLYFEGHVMLYLGNVDGEYYVISETARIMHEDEIINAHSCMITPLSVKRANGESWLSSLECIREIK